MIESPTIKQVEEYLEKYKKRGADSLELLGKYHPFVEAMNSELGRALLLDDVDRHDKLLVKIYNEDNVTPQDLAEFRYLKKRIKLVSDRFEKYIQLAEEVKSGGRGKEAVAR